MTKKKDKKLIVVFLLLSFYLLSLILSLNINFNFANAQETIYSNVLSDLQKDESFKKEDYPVVENDFSLKVIQIAESEDKELFVYVYQPCPNKDLKATTINISTNEGVSYSNWTLTLLNQNETLYKYLVKDFIVLNNETRYYDITTIYRLWNKKYDNKSENNNIINEVPYAVAKEWKAETVDGKVVYDCVDIDVIEIIDKYVGLIRYKGGYTWDGITYGSADNHFVAFSTDKPIDCLLEADVSYQTRTCNYYHKESMTELTSPTYTYGDTLDKTKHLTASGEDFYQGNIFHKRYTWDKISSVNNFINNVTDKSLVFHTIVGDVYKVVSLTKEGLDEIKEKQWVLRFDTTEYKSQVLNGSVGGTQVVDTITTIDSTQVLNVSILKLKFRTAGNVYSLGVIDNKQTGDGEPDNTTTNKFEMSDWLKWVLIVVGIFVLFCMIVLLWPLILKLVVLFFKFVVLIFKGLWWFITLPFRIFKDKS